MSKLNTFQKVFIAFFISILGLWVYIHLTCRTSPTAADNVNFWYSFLFGLIPLVGGAIGILKSGIWGGFKSVIGKAIFFFALGLLCWGFGETIWSYYNFFKHQPAPYPSIADIGF